MASQTRAETIIHSHVVFSMAAATTPVPIADVAAVTAVQLEMIRNLAARYGSPWDAERVKAVVVSLAGASAARIGASALKSIPIAGTLVGGAAQAVLSGASTYAVGQMFRRHFEREGDLGDLVTGDLRARYRAYVARGRLVARELRRSPRGQAEHRSEPPGPRRRPRV